MTEQPRPPLAARLTPAQQLAVDGAASAVVGAVAWLLLDGELRDWWSLAGVLALVMLPLVLGRRYPLVSLGLALVTLYLSPLASAVSFAALAPVSYALFRVALGSRPVVAVVALFAAVAGAVSTALPDLEHRGAVIPFAMLFITVWTVGYACRQQRAYVSGLAHHHRRLAEAEISRARRAIVEERLEMARELHDVVAHSMTVVTVQAGYGHLVIGQEPERAREALGVIEVTGRKALAELRILMDVLRRDEASDNRGPLNPIPGLADLAGLLADTERAGVVVELTVRGTPRPLPLGIDLSAYRIMQEALTNVVKHAGVGEARAIVDFGTDAVTISVIDHGTRRRVTDETESVRGHGLIGMQERVSTYGGTLHAEPMPDRGFRVSAHLPVIWVSP